MAYMVARTEKRKVGNLAGYQIHVDRKTDNHENKDIDVSKSHLNYDLVGHDKTESFKTEIMDYIEKNKVSERAVRKDAVVLSDWIIGSSQDFFDNLTEDETKKYFEVAVKYFGEKFGKENLRFATVHMDEKTPHMHLGIVPLKDGRLTAKTIFTRECLREVQNELPQRFQEQGFDIQRGTPKSEQEHVQPDVFKKQMQRVWEAENEVHKALDKLEVEKIKSVGYSEVEEGFHDINEIDFTLVERLKLFEEKKKEMLLEARELRSKNEKLRNDIKVQEEVKSETEELIRAQKSELKSFSETIKAIIDPTGVHMREDEPVYAYIGYAPPAFIGTVKEVCVALKDDSEEFFGKLYDKVYDKVEGAADYLSEKIGVILEKYMNHDIEKSELENALLRENNYSEPDFKQRNGQVFFVNPTKNDLNKHILINEVRTRDRLKKEIKDFTPESKIQEVSHHVIQNHARITKGRSV